MTYGNDAFRAGMRALARDRAARAPLAIDAELYADPSEWARPGGIVTVAQACDCPLCKPCDCDACVAGRLELAPPSIDGIMAGVDMPGRIVDDVRPDQRGGE